MKVLRSYQIEGVKFLTSRGSALLGDEPGLGKTVQTISALKEVEAKRVLVFAPVNMLYVWKEEIEDVDPGVKVFIMDGTGANKRKTLMQNYEGSQNDRRYFVTNWHTLVLKNPPPFENMYWSAIVADEAHVIKNRRTATAKALKKISNGRNRKMRKIALTGTPFVNNADEVWSILNWLDPKRWSSYWAFVNTYMRTWDAPWGKEIAGLKYDGALLRDDLRPWVLRRLKSDVLRELPEKQFQYIWTDISKKQYDLYQELTEDFVATYEDEELVVSDVLVQLIRFRQCVVSPRLLGAGFPDDSPRLDAIAEYIKDLEAPVVVFSEFVGSLELLKKRLPKKLKTYTLTGDRSAKDRFEAIEQFQATPDGEAAVMLATTGAGGVGITLHRASTVVYIDRSWSMLQDKQSQDRLHRHGQKNAVNVVTFGIPGTIDVRVLEVLDGKYETFGKVFASDIVGKPPKPGEMIIRDE